jgi:hypothetical protein
VSTPTFKFRGKVLGVHEMSDLVYKIAKQFPSDVAKAGYTEGEIEVTEMKRRCPVDTTPHAPHPGNLRASIHQEDPQQEGNVVTLLFATGKQAPYAVYVHENPEAIHPIGQWKFMESVLQESAPFFGARVGKRLNFDNKTAKDYGVTLKVTFSPDGSDLSEDENEVEDI